MTPEVKVQRHGHRIYCLAVLKENDETDLSSETFEKTCQRPFMPHTLCTGIFRPGHKNQFKQKLKNHNSKNSLRMKNENGLTQQNLHDIC